VSLKDARGGIFCQLGQPYMGLRCPVLLQLGTKIIWQNHGFSAQIALKQKLGERKLPKKLVVIYPNFP
jgi:hypothetical protein